MNPSIKTAGVKLRVPDREDWQEIIEPLAMEIAYSDDNLHVKAAKLVKAAAEDHILLTDEQARRALMPDAGHLEDEEDGKPAPVPSDEGTLSRGFIAEHPHFRHVAKMGCWFAWDGERWLEDETRIIYEAIKGYFAGYVDQQHEKIQDGLRHRLLRSNRIRSLESYLQSSLEYAMRMNDWDAYDWVLSTPGGMVDLKTGKLRPARPEDYCLQHAAVTPAEGPCPLWLGFLDKVTGGDVEMIRYLQKQAGYFLTGSTKEEALFFYFGQGGNGKSTWIETISGIMGDYAKPLPLGMLLEQTREEHATQYAGIYRCRFVSTAESGTGKWNQTKINYLTGGDTISARFMRGDYFQYRPKFKIAVAGNTRPMLDHVDDAARRRLHMSPFKVKIEPVDKDFKEKLRSEWPQILAWMIQGCILWQQEGLARCGRVQEETALYFEEADKFGQFLSENCDVDLQHPDVVKEPTKNLWESWKRWCGNRDEKPGDYDNFQEQLGKRGFLPAKGAKGIRLRKGIKLKEPPVSIQVSESAVIVRSPYSKQFVEGANILEGIWEKDDCAWIFGPAQEDDVRALIARCFPGTTVDTKESQ